MKKFLALSTALLMFSFFTMAQEDVIEFEEETHNFGKIPQGVPVTFKFKFKNTGDEPIIIENVQKSCGCTVTDWEKEPVMPGEEGYVSAQYNAAAMNHFKKPITVHYRIGDKTYTKRLFFEGQVVKEVEQSGVPKKEDNNITNPKN